MGNQERNETIKIILKFNIETIEPYVACPLSTAFLTDKYTALLIWIAGCMHKTQIGKVIAAAGTMDSLYYSRISTARQHSPLLFLIEKQIPLFLLLHKMKVYWGPLFTSH